MESSATTYSNFTSRSTEMTAGEGYDIVVSLFSQWPSDIGGLWIDWNQDGDFDDFDEEITTDWMGTGPYMTTIYPPLDAVLGTTRMRVRIQDSDTRPYLSPYDTMGYGEVEDYSIELVEAEEESGSGDEGTGEGGEGEPDEFIFDYFPQMIDAHLVHQESNTGQYNTVAIIDTGCWIHDDLMFDSSGAVALLLTQNPHLTPDEVKGRLMGTATPAVETDGSGQLGYSIFQQGAGLINAYEGIHGSGFFTANEGLDVSLDLDGVQHYGGLANCTEDGVYYIMGLEGEAFEWDSSSSWSTGYMWSDGLAGSAGYMWSDALSYTSGYMWSDAYSFSSGYMWSDGLSETTSINSWVWQE